MITPESTTCNIICLVEAHDKDSLSLSSVRICHAVLYIVFNTTTHSSPAEALKTGQHEGNPWHPNPWKHSSDCVYLCVYMWKCVSRLNRSNMWAQLESRHLFYPLLHWLKFQSQKEHNMNFWSFFWGNIKLYKVKQRISSVFAATIAKFSTLLVTFFWQCYTS